MSGDRISSSRGLNASYATEESSYNTKLGDGGSKFKMGCSPKKGFPEKTISDRKSNMEKFIENNQVIKLTKKFNLNGDEKEPKTGMKLGIEVKISNPKNPLGKGSFGAVYDAEVTQLGNVDQDKKENNIKYAVKVPKNL